MSPKELLWADSEGYQRRLEKSAIALIAVQRALSAAPQSVAGRDEFIQLYQWVARADPNHFTRVWRDPSAYFWVRRAVHFLASLRGEPLGTAEREYCGEVGVDTPAAALEHHLREFKRFALALAIISGTDISFDEPYSASLPMAIPGTPYVLSGDASATIAGFRHGAIELINPSRKLPIAEAGSSSDQGAHLELCPVIRCDEVRVFLNPAMFRVPGLGIPREWTMLPLSFQFEQARLVSDALAAIRRYQPMTFSHLTAGLHTLALKPEDATFINVTASELPGAFVCTVPADPYVLAASFIHEFHHNTLFGIEERGPFFEMSEEDVIEGENHYSPWVETLRPLHGILHAVYVFLPVYRYWSAALREGSLGESQLGFAREQMARIPMQLQMGINQLRRHARLTPLGTEILEALASEAAEVGEESRALGLTLKTPVIGIARSGALRPLIRGGRQMTVGESLLEHLEASDTLGECAAEKAEITRALALN
jgi:HEXXH motif-containing protein